MLTFLSLPTYLHDYAKYILPSVDIHIHFQYIMKWRSLVFLLSTSKPLGIFLNKHKHIAAYITPCFLMSLYYIRCCRFSQFLLQQIIWSITKWLRYDCKGSASLYPFIFTNWQFPIFRNRVMSESNQYNNCAASKLVIK